MIKRAFFLIVVCFFVPISGLCQELSYFRNLLKLADKPYAKTTKALKTVANQKSEILRGLPYPFRNVVSLVDDIDATKWKSDIAIQDDLFDKYGFNIGRSMFMYMPRIEVDSVTLTNQDRAEESDSIINWPPFENSTYYLLRRYFDGGIQYIHMWSTFEKLINRTAIIAKQHLSLTLKGEKLTANKAVKVFRNVPSDFPGMRLYLTVNEKVDGVTVQIIDRNKNTFNWCIGNVRKKSECRWLSDLPPPKTQILKAILFDDTRKDKTFSTSPYDYKWSALNFIVDGKAGAKADVEEVLFSAFNRKLVERQIELLKKLGIAFWMYSDHGGADYGANLMEQRLIDGNPEVIYPNNDKNVWAQKDKDVDITITNHAEGATPGSDYYFADLTGQFGTIYYLFGNGSSKNYDTEENDWGGYALSELLVPYRLPNGRFAYDTNRYFPGGWDPGDKGEPYSMTWNGRFGQVLDYIFAKIDRSGPDLVYGPIITHLGFEGTESRLGFKPQNIKPGAPFNHRTQKALKQLSNRFYNFSGDVNEAQRIWVTSPSRLYRYAQISRLLKDHIEVDEQGNVVISSWKDEITGEQLPDKNHISRDLAGITVYVPDSNVATVTVDGESVFDFSRNPKDLIRRESITFVDLSTLHVISDKVWPKAYEGLDGEVSIKTEPDAPGSGNFLVLRPKKLGKSATLSIPVAGINRDQHAQTNFSFWARTDNNQAELAVSYSLETGEKFDVVIKPEETSFFDRMVTSSKAPTWKLRWGRVNEWRRYVVSFSDATFKGAQSIAPRGKVKSITLSLSNGKKVDIAQIAFGRDNPFPSINKGNIFSGRIASLEDGYLVKAHFDNLPDRQVETNHTGYFLLTDIPVNTVLTGLDVYTKSGDQYATYDVPIQLQSSIVGLTIPTISGESQNVYEQVYHNHLAWKPGLIPRNRLPQSRLQSEPIKPSGQYRVYSANKMQRWGGMGVLQEYDAIQYANNLGFLDRKDRYPAPGEEDSFNLLLFGGCLFAGDQFSVHDPKINELLEEKLRAQLKRPVEAPLFANTWLNPHSYNLIYDQFGQQYRPKLVIVEVMMSTFRNASPYLSAVENNLHLGALNSAMLDVNADGSFFVRDADPAFFLKTKKWDLDMKGVTAHAMSTLTKPLPWMEKELDRSTEIITENLKSMRDKIAQHGGKLVLVLIQDRYALTQPRQGIIGQMAYDADVPDKRFRSIAKKLDIPYLNLVKALEKKPNGIEAQWVFDPHWTPQAHELAADIIMDFLVEKRLIPEATG